MKFNRTLILFFVFILFLFSSCENDKSTRIYMTDSFEWALTDAESTIYDADQLNYMPVSFKHSYNLEQLVGSFGNYVWLRGKFTIPEALKNQDLALSVAYLHFADKVWINGNFAGSYGHFPPKEASALYQGHCYDFPQFYLNQEGENTILIKVWCHGRSEVSNQIFVSDKLTCHLEEKNNTMKFAKIYMYTEGGMFTAFLIYLLFYLGRKKEKQYLYFALMNFFSLQLVIIFFVTELPEYSKNSIPFLLMYKYIPCVCFYNMIFYFSMLMVHYVKSFMKKSFKIIHVSILVLTTLITAFAKDYNMLIRISPYMMLLTVMQVLIALFEIADAYKEKKRQIMIFSLGASPILLGAIADIILREIVHNTSHPYFIYFGWQFAIIAYLVNLTIRYSRVYQKMEYLAENLQMEVESQTKELTIAKESLENEINKANIDLKMAAIVQKKFLPEPDMVYVGWDVAVSYEPLSEVSGDLYDYYGMGKMLDGIALFDVSGHGIASSLITTLAKNIIFQCFKPIRFNLMHTSHVMSEIDKNIKKAKGNIENYLTGVLFHFSLFDKSDVCQVEMANAGHPHPLLYVAEENKVIELKPDNTFKQIGAIGMNGVDVNCVDVNFRMAPGDILISYTDGLTEALNENHKQFGKESVKDILFLHHDETARDITKAMTEALNAHLKDCLREDDVTMIVLKRERSEDYLEPIG